VKAEVVDSHHHLWDPAALRYSLFENVEELNRPYTLAQFDGEAEQLGIGRSICVEAVSAGLPQGLRPPERLTAQGVGWVRGGRWSCAHHPFTTHGNNRFSSSF
jgi:hypothetical protein